MIEKNTPLYGKKSLLVGASESRHGYASLAFDRLTRSGHEVILLGKQKGVFEGEEILDIHTQPIIRDIDTITLYINPSNQEPWFQYLIGLRPRRIIFNPGTENDTFKKLAEQDGIETVYGCTLVMLGVGTY